MTTDATTPTRPENPHALDAVEPRGNWFVLLAPSGDITVARMPPMDSPPDEISAFYRDAFQSIPPGVAPKGVLGMSLGNGAGSLALHVYDQGSAPSREQLAKLRPLVLSRWSARVHTYGETRYEENFPGLFGLKGEPAILRTGPEIGPALAASCIGKHVAYAIRPDGLRVGGWDIRDFAGFIETAQPDADGIVATLLIVSPLLHGDLEELDADGELESARLCLSHSARAVPRQTAWNVKVFDLTHAAANHLSVTSLAHSLGTVVLRRLAIDEPLGPADYRPVERLHVPRRVSDWRPSTVVSWPPAPACDEPSDVAQINPGSITTAKRQILGSISKGWSVPASSFITDHVDHSLGVVPLAMVDSGAGAVVGTVFNAFTTAVSYTLVNLHAIDHSGTVTVYMF